MRTLAEHARLLRADGYTARVARRVAIERYRAERRAAGDDVTPSAPAKGAKKAARKRKPAK